MKQVHDGKPGRDHDSTMRYIETRCVDYGGVPAAAQMRTWPGRPARGDVRGMAGRGGGGDKKYPTRLADGTELHEHDDWDCLNDFEAAGLLVWEGTGLNPIIKLTDRGWRFAGLLRRRVAEKNKAVSLQEMFGLTERAA